MISKQSQALRKRVISLLIFIYKFIIEQMETLFVHANSNKSFEEKDKLCLHSGTFMVKL